MTRLNMQAAELGASMPVHQSPPAAPQARQRERPLTADPADAFARVAIAGLFLAMAYRIGLNFAATGKPTGLLLLASELLVVILTIARRQAVIVDRAFVTRAIAGLSLIGPPLVRPSLEAGLVPELLAALLSTVGLIVVIGGKISLGRSFGLLPANRGIVSSGLYGLVRHPIYLGYLVTHVAFLLSHPTWWNLLVLVGADLALVVRSCYEERTLVQDPAYASYCERVRWRLMPGVF